MPDITMCQDRDCPKAPTCFRSEASGTTPTPLWQSWYAQSMRETSPEGDGCTDYWPIAAPRGDA